MARIAISFPSLIPFAPLALATSLLLLVAGSAIAQTTTVEQHLCTVTTTDGPEGRRQVTECIVLPSPTAMPAPEAAPLPEAPAAAIESTVPTAPAPVVPVAPAASSPAPAAPAAGPTFEVGTGFQHATISAAIAAAPAGSTIVVHAGVYPEQLTFSKRLTIQAAGDGEVWLEGGCARRNGIHMEWTPTTVANDSVIRGIGMRNMTQSGVIMADGATLDGVTVHDWDCDGSGYPDTGIFIGYAGHVTVKHSTVLFRSAAPATLGANCIMAKSTSQTSSGGGHYFGYNSLRGCFDGIGAEGEDEARGGWDGNSIFEFNHIQDCNDDGIQIDGNGAGIIVRDNLIERCGLGISFAPIQGGGVARIERNRMLDLRPGHYQTTACFKVGDAKPNPTTAIIVDNECRTTEGGDGFKQTNVGNSPYVLQGNVFRVGRYVLELGALAPGSSIEGGCWYTTDPSRLVSWNGTGYFTVEAFRAATGQFLTGTYGPECGAAPSGG